MSDQLTLQEKMQATSELFNHIMKIMPIVAETLGDEATWLEKKIDEFETLTINATPYPKKGVQFVLVGYVEGEEKEIEIPHDLITTPSESVVQWAIEERNRRMQMRLEAERKEQERKEAKRKAEEAKDREQYERLKAKHGWA